MPQLKSAPPPPALASPRSLRLSRRQLAWFVCGLLVLSLAGGVWADWWWAVPDEARARYVGRQSCIQCHAREASLFAGSHHDLAMDRATAETVLGDFADAEFTHFGQTSRMFREGEKFMIHTEGPDGTMQDFQVKYVFGVDPLQQYMVEFDRPENMPAEEVARLQVLRISWDTRQRRWFYLPPPDVDEKLDPRDDLHWTGIAQRWNNMCADCHSTNLQKNYDPQTQTYHTTFSEIDVSCEACHGPGSLHVELATSRSLFWDRKRGYGLPKLKDAANDPQIHACAPCHSRRRVVHPGFVPGENYYDYYANEGLGPLTYHADGQILDEVYEFGSFIQSKMYHKNVRCTDCHDPHSARLKHEGNKVCTSCHQHPAGKYDAFAHHRHKPESTGASCVECHMPQTTYMEVDPRRDHSLRIPRPDLSVSLGTPNACTRCHLDEERLPEEKRAKLAEYADWLEAARAGDEVIAAELRRLDQWAAQAVKTWYGSPKQEPDFATTLSAVREDPQQAEEALRRAANRSFPGIARASLVHEALAGAGRQTLPLAARLLNDPDPQVRAAALAHFAGQSPEVLKRYVLPLLQDPRRLVRTEAARVMAPVPWQDLKGEPRELVEQGLEEYRAGLLVNNDRAGAYLPLGVLAEERGDDEAAIGFYETAIAVEPRATGPRSNLASLLERRAEEAGQRYQQALSRNDSTTAARWQQQLAGEQQRIKQLREEELEFLGRDARLLPENAILQYRLGLALYLNGRLAEAEESLRRAWKLEPESAEFVLALALLYQKLERLDEARKFAERAVELRPDDPGYRQLLQELQDAPR